MSGSTPQEGRLSCVLACVCARHLMCIRDMHAAPRDASTKLVGSSVLSAFQVVVTLPERTASTSVAALFYHKGFGGWFTPAHNRAVAGRLRVVQQLIRQTYGPSTTVPPILVFDVCNRTHPFAPEPETGARETT